MRDPLVADKKRGPGRPTEAKTARSRGFTIRMTPEEREMLDIKAKRRKMTATEYVRRRIFGRTRG